MGSTDNIAYHRKYRPMNLDEYMGDAIKETIKARFSDESRYPQTILLSGPRGTGKTSIARLIGMELQCQSKVDGHACGKCEICEDIREKLIKGQAGVECMGVQEVDIASDSGKAAIDDVLEEALIAPVYMKYRILILDECHMMTKQAQNRLLKILEEPPKHLVFILCTTNPEDLLGTVLSRCQLKLEVKKPSIDELADRLLYVCKQEKITASMEALRIIAKKSERITREALNLLEMVAKDCGYQVTVDTVRSKTGDVAAEIYMAYYQAANDSLEQIMIFNKRLKEQDISPKNFIKGLTRFTLDCINLRYGIGIEEYPLEYAKKVKKFFGIYNSEEMDTLLQIIEYANKMIDEDDTKAELIITTTAMRIGKTKLLAVGLTNEVAEANKENKVSFSKYKEFKEEEREGTKTVTKRNLDSSLLVSVFGKNVSEVKGGINLALSDKAENEDSDESGLLLTDEELINMFTRKTK